ncbi:MAG: MarR family winged helix-turn-helix transcriptional regulator [Acidovorax sp.]|uniref:MarR family winged helix-turn-helix transcriptional regulator n=1 Tax=Acidovorax sp. TaxID=1872122 RepID=UPI0039E6585D
MPQPPDSPSPRFYGGAASWPPEQSVGYLMRKVMTSIRTQADAQLAAHDLTYAQWVPLFKMSRCPSGPSTVAGLARELETDPASMTRALDRMQAKGLVVRERSAADRRVVHVALTPEGQRVAAQVPAVLGEVLDRHLSDFSHDEWQQLLGLLRRMLANGEAQRQQTCPPNP